MSKLREDDRLRVIGALKLLGATCDYYGNPTTLSEVYDHLKNLVSTEEGIAPGNFYKRDGVYYNTKVEVELTEKVQPPPPPPTKTTKLVQESY